MRVNCAKADGEEHPRHNTPRGGSSRVSCSKNWKVSVIGWEKGRRLGTRRDVVGDEAEGKNGWAKFHEEH